MTKLSTILLTACLSLTVSTSMAKSAPEWNYDNDSGYGPQSWGEHFADCETGGFQSPINIDTSITDQASKSLQINFQEFDGKIMNNGHTDKATSSEPIPNFVVYDGVAYSLIQFHFHSLSENELDGKQLPMEAHYVTQNKDGQYLVLGVFIDVGQSNGVIGELWADLDKGDVALPNKEMRELFPKDLTYYTFDGSFTTPGCDQGVTWVVFKNPIQESQAQLEQFESWYSNNYRPVQPLNGRKVQVGVAVGKKA